MFASAAQDRVVYRITDSDGTLLAGYSDVPEPVKAMEGLEPRYFDATFRGQPIRAVALLQPLIGIGEHHFALVIIGQTLHAYEQMVDDLWTEEIKRQLVLVVIAAALAWFGLNRGLAPLARISAEIAQRPPDTLDLIEIGQVQKELRPVVGRAQSGRRTCAQSNCGTAALCCRRRPSVADSIDRTKGPSLLWFGSDPGRGPGSLACGSQ